MMQKGRKNWCKFGSESGTYLEVKHGAKWDAKVVEKMDAILDANLDANMVLLRMQILR